MPCNDPSRSELDFEAIAKSITSKTNANDDSAVTAGSTEGTISPEKETTSRDTYYTTKQETESYHEVDTTTTYANYTSTSTPKLNYT